MFAAELLEIVPLVDSAFRTFCSCGARRFVKIKTGPKTFEIEQLSCMGALASVFEGLAPTAFSGGKKRLHSRLKFRQHIS
jgi:hypothetical protein